MPSGCRRWSRNRSGYGAGDLGCRHRRGRGLEGRATPFAFIVAGIGALGLALIYGRFARYVPHAGGTYAIVRAGLGRDAGFFAGWTVLAVGLGFVPALLVAGGVPVPEFFWVVVPPPPGG